MRNESGSSVPELILVDGTAITEGDHPVKHRLQQLIQKVKEAE
jgi:hypothetical protein